MLVFYIVLLIASTIVSTITAHNCVICPDGSFSNNANVFESWYQASVDRSVSTTPTCSNTADVALVYYSVATGRDCTSSGASLQSDSIWFGITTMLVTLRSLVAALSRLPSKCIRSTRPPL
jgi:hypothetical protein